MSDLTDAATNLSNAATRANKTTDFFDGVTTLGPTSTVKNPNNNKTVPSVQKQVKDLFDALPPTEEFTELEAAALAAGTTYDNITYSTNLVDEIKGYIFDADTQITYAVPEAAQGKFIQSVVDGVLTTTDANEYTLAVSRDYGAVADAMATQVKHRRGNTNEITNFTPALGEIVMNTETNRLILGDGVTPGGLILGRDGEDILVQDFGFRVDAPSAAASNTNIIESIVDVAYELGRNIRLPFGKKYLNSCAINRPVGIVSNAPKYGAPLTPSIMGGVSDVYHMGGGFAFDFLPIDRNTAGNIADGASLSGLTFTGTASGEGAWRVNNATVIGDETYARRNFTAENVRVTEYKSGYGYSMFWTFSNVFTNVVVWNCAVPYQLSTAHASNHNGCVYENCSWGMFSLNCFANDHFGCTVEGIRAIAGMTAPADYDTNGNYATANEYRGIANRTRGGTSKFYGGYFEANRVHTNVENNGEVIFNGTYIGNTVLTEHIAIGGAGIFRQIHTRMDEDVTTGENWVNVSGSLLCNYAEIHSNQYKNSTKPTSVPNISEVGEFDVYGDIADTNAAERVFLGQNIRVGGSITNSGVARRMTTEEINIRNVYLGNSSIDRTVDLAAQTTRTGYTYFAQQGGVLTIEDNSDIGAGRTQKILVSAIGSGVSVKWAFEFRAESTTSEIPDGRTMVFNFVSLNDKWIQDGTASNVLT